MWLRRTQVFGLANLAVLRADPTLVVPATAVARTTEGTFVVRLRDGNVDWVTVQTGGADGKLVEFFANFSLGTRLRFEEQTSCVPALASRRKKIEPGCKAS